MRFILVQRAPGSNVDISSPRIATNVDRTRSEEDAMVKPGRPKGTTTKPNPAAGPAEAETTSGYFRRVFKENPTLLGSHSNAELFNHWLADHPGHAEVPKN